MNPALTASKRMDWATPRGFAQKAAEHFEQTIALDVCASENNAVAAEYIAEFEDALTVDWANELFNSPIVNAVAWMNPPYGRELSTWITKACLEADEGAWIIALVPARTDTKWFINASRHARNIAFLAGRLHFDDGLDPAPFPSCLFLLTPGSERAEGVKVEFGVRL